MQTHIPRARRAAATTAARSPGRPAARPAARPVALPVGLPAVLLTALCALVIGGPAATPAAARSVRAAHAELRQSTPAGKAAVTSPPRVVLVFNENVRAEMVRTQVLDGGGGRHEDGRPSVQGGTVTQRVRGTLAPGAYAVVYWVVSADGHPVKGEVPFTVTGKAGPGAAPPAPANGTAPGPGPSGPGASAPAPAGAATPDTSGTATRDAASDEAAEGVLRWVWMFAGLFAGAGIGLAIMLWRKRASGR